MAPRVGTAEFVSGLVKQAVCCCKLLEVEQWVLIVVVSVGALAIPADILGRVDEEVVMIEAATASRTAIKVSLMVAVTVVVEVWEFTENGR